MSYNNSQLRIIEAQTFEERVENALSYADKNHKGYANVEAIRTRPEGSYLVKEWFPGANVVTDDGDIFYAQQAANETPTDDFTSANNRMELRATSDTPAKGDRYGEVATPVTATRKAITSTYPKTNDGDADNTASNKTRKVTWTYNWATGDFNQTGIVGGCIHNAAGSPSNTAGTGSHLLTHFSITSFDKTATDTLKIIINHDLLGA